MSFYVCVRPAFIYEKDTFLNWKLKRCKIFFPIALEICLAEEKATKYQYPLYIERLKNVK